MIKEGCCSCCCCGGCDCCEWWCKCAPKLESELGTGAEEEEDRGAVGWSPPLRGGNGANPVRSNSDVAGPVSAFTPPAPCPPRLPPTSRGTGTSRAAAASVPFTGTGTGAVGCAGGGSGISVGEGTGTAGIGTAGTGTAGTGTAGPGGGSLPGLPAGTAVGMANAAGGDRASGAGPGRATGAATDAGGRGTGGRGTGAAAAKGVAGPTCGSATPKAAPGGAVGRAAGGGLSTADMTVVGPLEGGGGWGWDGASAALQGSPTFAVCAAMHRGHGCGAVPADKGGDAAVRREQVVRENDEEDGKRTCLNVAHVRMCHSAQPNGWLRIEPRSDCWCTQEATYAQPSEGLMRGHISRPRLAVCVATVWHVLPVCRCPQKPSRRKKKTRP